MGSEQPPSAGEEAAQAAAEWGPKIRRAAQLLLAQRGLQPGAKGRELRRILGKGYRAILDALNAEVEALGLQVKAVGPEGSDDPDEARYYLVFRDPPPAGVGLGLRVDDIAMLAASLAYIKAKGGRCARGELEALLREKFPGWRVQMGLRRFVRMGYMVEEGGVYGFGWRTKAEVNLASLSTLMAALPTGEARGPPVEEGDREATAA